MAYQDPKVYAKYLKDKCVEESSHSHKHGGCSDCNEEDKCSCCEPGLVAVYDDNGHHTGCLVPEDAEELHASTFTCQDGYIKLYKEGTPNVFLGCVSESEFVAAYAAVNPTP